MNRKTVLDNLLVKHVAGSHSYGLATASSDMDYRGVYCAPRKYHTPFFSLGAYQDPQEEDTTYWELAQFVKYVGAMNPNVLETLWVRRRDLVYFTGAYEVLRSYREDLLSKRVVQTTAGFATSEFKRLTTNLEGRPFLQNKAACHVVRLLRMGLEVLTEGTVNVYRTHDADQLLAIKNGSWTLEWLSEFRDETLQKMDEAAARSSLPDAPDVELLANVLMEVQDLVWKN